MKIGLIIIGDEILSGKRRDRHFAHVVSALAGRGMELGWCRIIGDEPALISATLQQTFSSGDLVFCCGGIGATPDDYTRAEPDAERILRIRPREGEQLTLTQDFVAHHPHCRLSPLPEIGPEPGVLRI